MWSWPGNGRIDAPWAEQAREIPSVPGDVVGFAVGTVTGPNIMVYWGSPSEEPSVDPATMLPIPAFRRSTSSRPRRWWVPAAPSCPRASLLGDAASVGELFAPPTYERMHFLGWKAVRVRIRVKRELPGYGRLPMTVGGERVSVSPRASVVVGVWSYPVKVTVTILTRTVGGVRIARNTFRRTLR